MASTHNTPGLFCLSFDAVALSGIIVEFLKIAEIFHQNDYAIFLDLGYEIKADKQNFFRPYSTEKDSLPSWIHLVKVIDTPFDNYSSNYVETIFTLATQHPEHLHPEEATIEHYATVIAKKIVSLWKRLNIRTVIIENGTLPENIIMTRAVYKAIEWYGNELQLKRFVLWRDHDLMWSSESSLQKYGKSPYHHIPKLKLSSHITHTVLHQTDLDELKQWDNNARAFVLENTFSQPSLDISEKETIKKAFRAQFNIPQDAYLLARFTRIIPQKRIDRDIQLTAYLNQLSTHPVYLLIAGNPNENIMEWNALNNLTDQLCVRDKIIFVGDTFPYHSNSCAQLTSVRNLLLASDLCSFLTSYNYESFGNPISEAISLGKAYITTSYERYSSVYQQQGYQGLIFPISEKADSQITLVFAKQVYAYLQDTEARNAHISLNSAIMRQHIQANPSLTNLLNQFLDIHLR